MILEFISSDDGQSLVEYTLIISLVVLVAVGSLFLFGQQILSVYEESKEMILDGLGE